MSKYRYTPRKILIVDGYNIINAWKELKDISVYNLEQARDLLKDRIIEWANIKGYEAFIIFDAYNVKGSDERIFNEGKVQVIFTKEKQTADSYIEKFISGLSKYDEVSVATSDYAEQQIVLGTGCSRVTARELIHELNISKQDIRNKNAKNTKKNNQMNRLEHRIDSDIFDKLEKIRRMR